MAQPSTRLIVGSGLEYHRCLDEPEQEWENSAVPERIDIENEQAASIAPPVRWFATPSIDALSAPDRAGQLESPSSKSLARFSRMEDLIAVSARPCGLYTKQGLEIYLP